MQNGFGVGDEVVGILVNPFILIVIFGLNVTGMRVFLFVMVNFGIRVRFFFNPVMKTTGVFVGAGDGGIETGGQTRGYIFEQLLMQLPQVNHEL